MPLIDNLEDLVARFDAFLHKGQEYSVLILAAVEEGAGVAGILQGRPGELDGSVAVLHVALPARYALRLELVTVRGIECKRQQCPSDPTPLGAAGASLKRRYRASRSMLAI
jgi:hypothetical protein